MMTTTKERPILYSTPMIRALLNGRKTQTRRVAKAPHDEPRSLHDTAKTRFRCPYGQPGDRLWCRETWALVNADEDGIDDWVDRGPIPDALPWPSWQVWYRAGYPWAYDHSDDRGFRWRPSIHMPRWASRIILEITDVRVERLQEISEEDAVAEGAHEWLTSLDGRAYDLAEKAACQWSRRIDAEAKALTAKGLFAALWENINGEGSWGLNPFVWVLAFRRLEGGAR